MSDGVTEASDWKELGKRTFAIVAPLIAILISIVAGIFSFLQFLLFGFFYNIVAKGAGGFEFTLIQNEEKG